MGHTAHTSRHDTLATNGSYYQKKLLSAVVNNALLLKARVSPATSKDIVRREFEGG